MTKAALVLEGGSLRSLYTSGVLDVFMENNIHFECVIGVSAGALNAANYIANHIGRSAKINILHSGDPNYFGVRQFLLHGSIFNFNYLFFEPIKRLYPYNEAALETSKPSFLVGITNCKNGQVEYHSKNNYKELVQLLRASSSIPLLCKPVDLNGSLYLDGSIADPIPLHKAFSEGYSKVVVVLTRHTGYISKKHSLIYDIFANIYSKKYPEFIKTIRNRPNHYNSITKEINELENEGKIFVIRPQKEIKVRKTEKDARKLIDLYFQGRDDTRERLTKMQNYLDRAGE